MELLDAIKALSNAPKSGRAEFGQTVVMPEVMCKEIVACLVEAERQLAAAKAEALHFKAEQEAKSKEEAKAKVKEHRYVPKTSGAEPQ